MLIAMALGSLIGAVVGVLLWWTTSDLIWLGLTAFGAFVGIALTAGVDLPVMWGRHRE